MLLSNKSSTLPFHSIRCSHPVLGSPTRVHNKSSAGTGWKSNKAVLTPSWRILCVCLMGMAWAWSPENVHLEELELLVSFVHIWLFLRNVLPHLAPACQLLRIFVGIFKTVPSSCSCPKLVTAVSLGFGITSLRISLASELKCVCVCSFSFEKDAKT